MIKHASTGKIGDTKVEHIEIETKLFVLRQKLTEKMEYRAKEKWMCRISFVGPYIDGNFNLKTPNFLLKDCYVYQYVNGKNKGYCDFCDKKG